jgi:hypothetical protein
MVQIILAAVEIAEKFGWRWRGDIIRNGHYLWILFSVNITQLT